MACSIRVRIRALICLFLGLIAFHTNVASAQVNLSDPAFWNSVADAGDRPRIEDAITGDAGVAPNDFAISAGGLADVPAGQYVPPPAGSDLDRELSALQNEWRQFKADAARVKYPNVQINGFFQADVGFFDQSARNEATLGDIQDGAGFRRTRLSAKGAVAENVNYFVQMDFGFFGRPTFTDIWVDVTELPVLGNLRFGQWKQPMGLETVTSVRYQTFIERSVLFQTFEPFRHIGVGAYNHADDELSTWAFSIFKTGNDQFGNDIGDNAGISAAGRLTHLPWYEQTSDGSLYYLHLGSGFWHGNPGNDKTRYSTIPEFFIGAFGLPAGAAVGTSKVVVNSIANGTPPFVDTGTFNVNSFTHYGTELIWVQGPFSIQSEAMLAIVNPQDNKAQMHYKGGYLFASYFLTGESRPYDKKAGALDRVKPLEDFKSGCGWGAWELTARLSYIDLNDGDILGGRMTDFTAGTNWYLNPYTKFQLNYIKSNLSNPTFGKSHANMFGARVQLEF